MKSLVRLAVLCGVFLLAACGSKDGSSTDDPTGDTSNNNQYVERLLLSSSKDFVLPNGEDQVTFTVRAVDGNNVALENVVVDLGTSVGVLSPGEVTTDSDGKATFTLIADEGAGTDSAVVTATVGDVEVTKTISLDPAVTNNGNVERLLLSSSKDFILPDGEDQVTFTVRAVDGNNVALENVVIDLGASVGVLSPGKVITDPEGKASFTFIAYQGDGSAEALITAQVGSVEVSKSISLDPAAAGGATLTINSTLLEGELLTQQGEITIYADVTDEDGLPVVDGSPVYFNASAGSITRQASTVAGRATATFIAPATGGSVTINAGDELDEGSGLPTGIVDELRLSIASGPAVQIVLQSVTPERLGIRGSGVDERGTFEFLVTDGSGGPVQDGTIVDFSLDSPTGGAEFVTNSSVSTVDGMVSVSILSGTVPGVATVTASTEAVSGTIVTEARITMGYSQADQLHLGFSSERLNIPGQVLFNYQNLISVYVADRYSNPVPQGQPVYFGSECGIVSLNDEGGATLNLTNNIGIAQALVVTARPLPDATGLCRYVYWTEGEEAYSDSNANGQYDAGEPHQDVTEPYIDADDSGTFDAGELYFDLDGNGSFTGADNVWNGDIFVWNSSNLRWSAETAAPYGFNPQSVYVSQGDSETISFLVTDVNGHPLPSGTTVSASTECGDLAPDNAIELADAINGRTQFTIYYTQTDEVESTGKCQITIDVSAEINGDASTTINIQQIGTDVLPITQSGTGSISTERFLLPGNAALSLNLIEGNGPFDVTFVAASGEPVKTITLSAAEPVKEPVQLEFGSNYLLRVSGADIEDEDWEIDIEAYEPPAP